MIDDFLDNHKLNSRTIDQVKSLLGEPEDTGYFKDYEMVYWLGPERGLFSIDSEWLVINLDSNNLVTPAFV